MVRDYRANNSIRALMSASTLPSKDKIEQHVDRDRAANRPLRPGMHQERMLLSHGVANPIDAQLQASSIQNGLS
jgi:hypothetical protein